MLISNIIRRHGSGTLTALLLCLILGTGGAYGNNGGFEKQMLDTFKEALNKPPLTP